MSEQKKKRIKEAILNQKINENHITGIYNYCDRWCEKCSFTKRCASFSLEEEFGFEENGKNIQNKEFWENLSSIFEATAELLIEKAKELGIDLTQVANQPEEKEPDEKHPLIVNSRKFSVEVSKWLDKNSEIFKERIEKTSELNIESGKLLFNAVDIIQWYHILISAKFYKILVNQEADNNDQELIDYENGTIKVALLAIDRMIAGFGIIMDNFSELEDDCLGFLLSLSKIKSHAETIFPDARKFIRPGLDE